MSKQLGPEPDAPQPGASPLPHAHRQFVTPSNSSLDDAIRPILWPPVCPIVFDDIPTYPRSRYHSYLKVTGIQGGPIITTGPCRVALTVEEYLYTQPPAGQFNGSFPATPSRTFTLDLTEQPGKVVHRTDRRKRQPHCERATPPDRLAVPRRDA
jgi:hypothetical protein